MRRLLFVSCNYASDYGVMVWGTYVRMRMLLEAATRAADAVDLLLFVAPDGMQTAKAANIAASLKASWKLDVTVHLAPRSLAAHDGLASTVRGLFDPRFQPDYGHAGGRLQQKAIAAALRTDTALVVAHRLDASLRAVQAIAGRVPLAINFDDIEHVALRRRVARDKPSLRKMQRRIEVSAIRRAELAMMRSAQRLLVCSRKESEYLRAVHIATAIDVVQNAVPFPAVAATSRRVGKTIMFIGSYGYEPNIEAVEELALRIFPLVLKHVPDARLIIAGARSERLPRALAENPAIEVLGFIEDVEEIYSRADVACCAIRAGGGTRIKIIEAAAWQVPTVATPIGAEGLELHDGTEILLAESTEGLAEACVALLRDPARAAAIGVAARRRAVQEYEHHAVVDRIADSYRDTVAIFDRDHP